MQTERYGRNARYIAAGLSDEDMLWLLAAGRLRRLSPGEWLVRAGRAVSEIYFITEGRLTVMFDDGNPVAHLDQGDVVGEMSFVEQQPPLVSVIAEASGEVLAVPRQLILDRFEQEPAFGARFYRALATFLSERLRETTAAVRVSAEEQGDRERADRAARARFARLFVQSGP